MTDVGNERAGAGRESGRLGAYYGAGAALCAAAALAVPWTWLGVALLWPTLSLALAAASYLGLGPRLYGKRNGRLPWARSLLMAPVLLGQRLSLLHYRRDCEPWSLVTPRLAMGAVLTRQEAEELVRRGAGAVLDLTPDFSEQPCLRRLSYRNLAVLDLTAPDAKQLSEAVSFLREEVPKHLVFVHCKIGYSRSAAVVGAYLLSEGLAGSPEEAVARMREVRPSLVVRPEVWRALHRHAASLRSSTPPTPAHPPLPVGL